MTKVSFLVEDEELLKKFDRKISDASLTRTQGLIALMKQVVSGDLKLKHAIEVSGHD